MCINIGCISSITKTKRPLPTDNISPSLKVSVHGHLPFPESLTSRIFPSQLSFQSLDSKESICLFSRYMPFSFPPFPRWFNILPRRRFVKTVTQNYIVRIGLRIHEVTFTEFCFVLSKYAVIIFFLTQFRTIVDIGTLQEIWKYTYWHLFDIRLNC